MRQLVIGIDLDDTLNNLISMLLKAYNQKYNDHLTLDDITDYNVHKFLKSECKNIFQEFATDDLLINLQPEPYAIDVLRRLNEKHQIYFVTAAHPKTLNTRDQWLAQHLDFYSTQQLINCRNKSIIRLDVLVDDYPAQHTGEYYSLLYDKPWNRNCSIHRVYNWLDIEREINLLAFQNT